MTKTVLILGGSGKIGKHSAEAFWNAGWNVRHFDRASEDMTAAAMGADVIVNGLNPPNYHDWAKNIPAITTQVIAAAKASGASVVIPGNIYNFGLVNGEINEHTPQRPNSRKGKIRVEMEAAYRAAGVQTIVLRAGNFIDPDRNGCVMSTMVMRSINKGRLTSPGDPDITSAYAYVPDWAKAAVMLAEMRDDLARFEDVPFPGHAFTIRQLADVLEARLARKIRIVGFPWWAITALSPVWELARELREMRYLSEMDHWISGDRFAKLLPGFAPTPLEKVLIAGLPPEIHPDQSVRSGRAHSFA